MCVVGVGGEGAGHILTMSHLNKVWPVIENRTEFHQKPLVSDALTIFQQVSGSALFCGTFVSL